MNGDGVAFLPFTRSQRLHRLTVPGRTSRSVPPRGPWRPLGARGDAGWGARDYSGSAGRA